MLAGGYSRQSCPSPCPEPLSLSFFFPPKGSIGFPGFPGANGEKGTRVRAALLSCFPDLFLFSPPNEGPWAGRGGCSIAGSCWADALVGFAPRGCPKSLIPPFTSQGDVCGASKRLPTPALGRGDARNSPSGSAGSSFPIKHGKFFPQDIFKSFL